MIGVIGHETTTLCYEAVRVDCRQPMLRGELDDRISILETRVARQGNKTAVWLAAEGVDRLLNFGCVPRGCRRWLNSERCTSRFNNPQHSLLGKISWQHNDQNTFDTRRCLFKLFQPFSTKRKQIIRKPRQVFAWPRHAGYQPAG